MMDPIGHDGPHDTLQAARRLYDAFGAHDAEALLAAVTPNFCGVVAEGMPAGLGGTYHGAQSMLRRCWARVFALIDLRSRRGGVRTADAPAVAGADEPGLLEEIANELALALAELIEMPGQSLFADGLSGQVEVLELIQRRLHLGW